MIAHEEVCFQLAPEKATGDFFIPVAANRLPWYKLVFPLHPHLKIGVACSFLAAGCVRSQGAKVSRRRD